MPISPSINFLGIYVEERFDAQVLKRPSTRTRSAISTTIPVFVPDRDALFSSLWVSFAGVEEGCPVAVRKVKDAVGVGGI